MIKKIELGFSKIFYKLLLISGWITIWFFPIGTIIGVLLLLAAYGMKTEIKDEEKKLYKKDYKVPWEDENADEETKKLFNTSMSFRGKTEQKIKRFNKEKKIL